jgi:hypothetical protein
MSAEDAEKIQGLNSLDFLCDLCASAHSAFISRTPIYMESHDDSWPPAGGALGSGRPGA